MSCGRQAQTKHGWLNDVRLTSCYFPRWHFKIPTCRSNGVRLGFPSKTLDIQLNTVQRPSGRVYTWRMPALEQEPYAHGECRDRNRDHPVHPELRRHGPLLRRAIGTWNEMEETHAEERLLIVSTKSPRHPSQPTHAYVCPRQEQHAEDADPFSGLPIALRSQCDLACDGGVMLRVCVKGLRFN